MKDARAAELIQLLAEYSYSEGEVALSSGLQSDFYIDGKLATYQPRIARLIGRAVWEVIRTENVVGVGGLTLGSDAIAVSTMFSALDDGINLPGFSVRKERKEHGKQKMIEGIVPPPGARVAVVDDVVTSGGSVLDAVREARKADLVIAIVVALVDREAGARANIERQGLAFRAICTASEIRDAFYALHSPAGA